MFRAITRWIVLGGFAVFTSFAAAKTILGSAPERNATGEVSQYWIWFGVIITAGILLQIGAQIVFLQPRGSVKLKEGTASFANYFADWYQRPGSLRIYSRDLDWLAETSNQKIRAALEKKARSGQLTVYLLNPTDARNMSASLQGFGASIFTVRAAGPHYEYRISVCREENECSMIVRTRTARSFARNRKISTVRESIDGPYPSLAERFMETVAADPWSPPETRDNVGEQNDLGVQ